MSEEAEKQEKQENFGPKLGRFAFSKKEYEIKPKLFGRPSVCDVDWSLLDSLPSCTCDSVTLQVFSDLIQLDSLPVDVVAAHSFEIAAFIRGFIDVAREGKLDAANEVGITYEEYAEMSIETCIEASEAFAAWAREVANTYRFFRHNKKLLHSLGYTNGVSDDVGKVLMRLSEM